MIFVFTVNVVICLLLRIAPAEIAIAHLYLASSYVVGGTIIRWFGAKISMEYTIVGSTIVGGIAFTIYAAIVFHFAKNGPFLTWLFFISIWLPILICLAGSLVRVEQAAWRFFVGGGEPGDSLPQWVSNFAQVIVDPFSVFRINRQGMSWFQRIDWAHFGIAALSLLVTVGTFYGFVDTNNPAYKHSLQVAEETPESSAMLHAWQARTQIVKWGAVEDKGFHLVHSAYTVAHQGFPHPNFLRRGLQLYGMPPTLGCYLFDADRYLRIFKVLAFYVWFGLLFTCYRIGKEHFGVSGVYLLAMVVSSVLFGAIIYPLHTLTGSTYAGFAKPTLGCFHNTTQLLSLTVGAAGLYFTYGYLRNLRPGLNLGMAIIAASFFYKPSFFTIAAPAFALVILAGVLRKQLPFSALKSLALLFVVPIVWKLYSLGFDSPSVSLAIAVRPFLLYFGRTASKFPQWVTANPVLYASAILLVSYFFPILVTIGNLRIWKRTLSSLIVQVMLVMFVIGTVSSFVFVENNERMFHGNFAWGGQAAYLVILPLVFYGFQNLRTTWYQWLCWGVLSLHVWAGFRHLLHFVIAGKLM